MMKKLLLLAVLMLTAAQAWTANVDETTARAAAQRFLNNTLSSSGKMMSPAQADLELAYLERNTGNLAVPVYYIFNYDQGFVIVSGDDRAQEILAHGDRRLDLGRMPENMKFWLSTYKRQIEYLQAHPGLEVEKNNPVRDLRTPSVAPLLTAEWGQGEPYNKYCSFGGYTCLTGCAATSLSMVFYHWKYPTDPVPEVEGYTTNDYHLVVPTLPSITFDWDNMLDKYTSGYTTAQADAVAWLMRYVSQEEHMNYSPASSGAYGEDIMRAINFFGYDEMSVHIETKTRADDNGNDTVVNYTDDEWAALLQNELAEGRPVVYCAYDYDEWTGWSGHAFNVDGYTASDNTYHVNWGWSGDGNGDFVLNAFHGGEHTYNIEQQMIMGIQPPPQVPTIKVSPTQLAMNACVGKTAQGTITVKGKDLTGAITLTLNDESGMFSIDETSVGLSDQIQGKTIAVTYAPTASGTHAATITLSSPGVEDKTVTLNGTAVLETYTPNMLPADSMYINLTQFRADWTDETPAHNVDSYTLEVALRPAVEQLGVLEGVNYTGGYNNIALTAPWSGEGVMGGHSTIYISNSFFTGYLCFTVPDGYKDDIFSVQITTDVGSYGSGDVTVGSNQTAAAGHQFYPGETYTWLVKASEGDLIRITSAETYYSPDMTSIRVYAGNVNQLNEFHAAVEQGDANYRLIEGITDRFYTVKNLAEAGTFQYRVKAIYTDGTESNWSNRQKVTLFENGHGYDLGDVNHDGKVNISDVTDLINRLLSGNGGCDICADVNGDNAINISDVTDLINLLLRAH